ncbi:MAG: GntG family PLP-dependent aldolase, partial [Bacteroidota bacterium]
MSFILQQKFSMIIDFRSDTVTKPSPAMLQAIMHAAVGDDVFGEDQSVNDLEKLAAAMFGMEAALFCPSGTMTNQIAIKCHTQPGDEVICDATAHVYQYEGGGIAFNSGASVKLIAGNRGIMTAAEITAAINADDVHKAHTSLVCLENTSNRGGGSCYEMTAIQEIRQVCDENNLKFHLDGARLFNALVATGQTATDYGAAFHSISICLSKSLGCPVGSLLLGTTDFIKRARRIRKAFGGGMRQAGYLAAAGIYALNNNIERLKEDHIHATKIADALIAKGFEVMPVETNIIIFWVAAPYTAQTFVAELTEQNILGYAIGPMQVRLVVHLDITTEMVDKTIAAIEKLNS